MKPFNELPPRQKYFRKNTARIIVYGCFVLALYMGMKKIAAIQAEKREQYNRIEDTMMNYYSETKGQTDTLGMANYMRERLSPDDYKAWQRQDNKPSAATLKFSYKHPSCTIKASITT